MKTMQKAALALATLFVVGCATPVDRNGSWVLANLPGAASDAPRPTLEIDDARMSGFAGCNRLTAAIETDPNVAAFFRGNVATTRMMCPGPAMEMERAFLDALNSTGDARVEGDDLVFFDVNSQEIMRFSRAPR